MNRGVLRILRTQNGNGSDQCRDEKERSGSFQEHLLNRRLRPGCYFTASERNFRASAGSNGPERRLEAISIDSGNPNIYCGLGLPPVDEAADCDLELVERDGFL